MTICAASRTAHEPVDSVSSARRRCSPTTTAGFSEIRVFGIPVAQ